MAAHQSETLRLLRPQGCKTAQAINSPWVPNRLPALLHPRPHGMNIPRISSRPYSHVSPHNTASYLKQVNESLSPKSPYNGSRDTFTERCILEGKRGATAPPYIESSSTLHLEDRQRYIRGIWQVPWDPQADGDVLTSLGCIAEMVWGNAAARMRLGRELVPGLHGYGGGWWLPHFHPLRQSSCLI